MKTTKKIISSLMAVIMFISGSPVLQATEFAGLQSEILTIVKDGVNYQETDEIPSVRTLKKRYEKAMEIYEADFQTFSNIDENEIEIYKGYIDKLKIEAQQRVKTEENKYAGFKSKKEKEEVAFYTVLLEDMRKHNDVYNRDFWQVIRDNSYVTGIAGIMSIGGLILVRKGSKTLLKRIGFAAVTGSFIMVALEWMSHLFAQPSKPYFIPILSANETLEVFMEKPFYHLANFDKSGVDDFALFYNKSQKCSEVLYDAVDIEYHTAMNPTEKNMMDRIYTQTVDWNNLSTELKVQHLHNLATRLRLEAKKIEYYHNGK